MRRLSTRSRVIHTQASTGRRTVSFSCWRPPVAKHIQPVGIDGRRNLDLDGKVPVLVSEAARQRERNRLPGEARIIVGEDPQSLDTRRRFEGLNARARLWWPRQGRQTAHVPRERSQLLPQRPSPRRIKQTTCTAVDCLDGWHELLPRLDIAEKDPMRRLQPTIGPDNGRDDRREPLLCFDVIKRGMPEQEQRGRR